MKNDIILNGIYNEYKSERNKIFRDKGDVTDAKEYFIFDFYEPEIFITCQNIYSAEHQRKTRNFDIICRWYFGISKINKFKDYKIIFGTLTFTDEVLENTKSDTRRKYVRRFLQKNALHYIANIDFGEQKGREHYHFLAITEDGIKGKWKNGGAKYELVKLDKVDIKATKNYLLKLNNHSFKDTVKQTRLIKDRNHLGFDFDYLTRNIYFEEYRKFKIMVLSNC